MGGAAMTLLIINYKGEVGLFFLRGVLHYFFLTNDM